MAKVYLVGYAVGIGEAFNSQQKQEEIRATIPFVLAVVITSAIVFLIVPILLVFIRRVLIERWPIWVITPFNLVLFGNFLFVVLFGVAAFWFIESASSSGRPPF
jgi:hypothetical protein